MKDATAISQFPTQATFFNTSDRHRNDIPMVMRSIDIDAA